MARPRPFLFCRYQLLVDQTPLSPRAQLNALTEMQGQYVAVSAAAQRVGRRDSAIFRARSMTVDGEQAIAWSVGRKAGTRVTVEPDRRGAKLELKQVVDPGIVYADFVAIPRLGVMAVDDRSGDPHLGGRAAINRFCAIFEHIDGGEAIINLTTTRQDVDRAFREWELTEFSFTVRPFNPHPPGDLSRSLSENFKKDQIFYSRGSYKPVRGQRMTPSDDGPIAAVRELADDGYGQYAVRGVTEGGHKAQIRAPKFDEDRQTNERRQAEPRELRIVIETDVDVDDAVLRHALAALRNFYE